MIIIIHALYVHILQAGETKEASKQEKTTLDVSQSNEDKQKADASKTAEAAKQAQGQSKHAGVGKESISVHICALCNHTQSRAGGIRLYADLRDFS